MANRGDKLMGAAYFFLVLCTILVCLRSYTRAFVVRNFGWDDGIMVLALVVYFVFVAFLKMGTHYGIGKHLLDIQPPINIVPAIKYLSMFEMSYIWLNGIIKLSISSTLLRLVVQRRYVYFLYFSMIANIIVTITSFCLFLLHCRPVTYAWEQVLPHKEGKCFSWTALVVIGYSVCSATIILDVVYATLPWIMFWNLNMPRKTKGALMFVLSLGVSAAVVNIIRIKYVKTLGDKHDPLWLIAPALFLTVVEVGLGMTASCLASLRPFLRKLNFVGFESQNESSRANNQRKTLQSRTGAGNTMNRNSEVYQLDGGSAYGKNLTVTETVRSQSGTSDDDDVTLAGEQGNANVIKVTKAFSVREQHSHASSSSAASSPHGSI
ncbi:hypothetical protein IWX49DRAFT_597207 [Phyllosticta citricarpa]|uniref:Rhodopsin domain-containing protein n=2 Tax=Phyllosticta TaxID=121621 RepID=A0ABR1MC34_9PEZI